MLCNIRLAKDHTCARRTSSNPALRPRSLSGGLECLHKCLRKFQTVGRGTVAVALACSKTVLRFMMVHGKHAYLQVFYIAYRHKRHPMHRYAQATHGHPLSSEPDQPGLVMFAEPRKALQLMSEAEGRQMELDLITYNATINACRRARIICAVCSSIRRRNQRNNAQCHQGSS